MKILYITTIGSTMGFLKSFIKELLDEGNIVDIATNEDTAKVQDCYREWNCTIYHISCSRSPLKKGNIDAIMQIKKIVADGGYEIVHCHTPIAAACTRFACKGLRKKGVKVIYTAHGFHFYRGAAIKNWLIFYPIEKLCARWTDVLITINKEDYKLAVSKFRAKKVEYVPGVGIDAGKFANTIVDKSKKLKQLGIPENSTILFSVGELNANKNHEIVIRAVAELKAPNIHYVIAGEGSLYEYLLNIANELGIGYQIHLIGYRPDVAELYKSADIYILPSIREGLNVSVMEALASGLPVICSHIRGNVDMVKDGVNGVLVDPFNVEAITDAIRTMMTRDDILTQKNSCQASSQNYEVKSINKMMHKIYACIRGLA